MFVNLPLRTALRTAALNLCLTGLCLTGLFAPTAGKTAETALSAPGAPEELVARLQAASSVLAAHSETDVQELLAAALSDYRTLVQVLYDAGHFSPQVTIQLDGVEAARIQPLNHPRRINKIQIAVTPGPSFRFSRAEITPWPAASEVAIPEGYGAGKPNAFLHAA